MIVGSYFEGDNNSTVSWVQHNDYHHMISDLFNKARSEYLKNDWYGLMDPKLKYMISDIESFDHRVIQMSHDFIAASYRYLFCLHDEIETYPSDFDYRIYYLRSWRVYYKWENGTLSRKRNYQIPIVLSIAYQNTGKGYQAEDELNRRLLERYPYLDKPSYLYENINDLRI